VSASLPASSRFSISSEIRRRSSPPVRSLVSITTSARSRSGASIARSARIPSTILPSGASGWRRRVSL